MVNRGCDMTNQEEKKNRPNWLQRNWKILTMNAALFLFGSSHAMGKESNDGPNQDRNEFNTEINASDSHENKKLTGKYLGNSFRAADLVAETGTNDLSAYKFSAKELAGMKVGASALKLSVAIKHWMAHYNNEYNCLAAVKRALLQARLVKSSEVETLRSAYQIINTLDNNPNFVKINCDSTDFKKIKFGLIAYDKGETEHGHVDIVINGVAYSSKLRQVNVEGFRWAKNKSGKRYKQHYGEKNVYILKDTELMKESFEMCRVANLTRENARLWARLSNLKKDADNSKIMQHLQRVQSKLQSFKQKPVSLAHIPNQQEKKQIFSPTRVNGGNSI